MSPSALAQDRLDEAQQQYDRGKRFFREKKWDDALEALMKAWTLDPNPILVFNMGRVFEEKREYRRAVKYLQNYLLIAPDAPNAAAVKKRLVRLRTLARRSPRPGNVTITSSPPGASIYVDGQLVGRAPLAGLRVPDGTHEFVASLSGYETQRRTVRTRRGRPTQLNITLADMPSTVLIATEPADAQAAIVAPSPRDLGTCPCLVELSSGTYRLRVTRAGYTTHDMEFQKRPGERLKLPVIRLARAADATTGSLAIRVNVDFGEIKVDGEVVGRLPLAVPMTLPSGEASVEISAPGHTPWRGRVTIEPGRTTTLHAVLTPTSGPRPTGPSRGMKIGGWVAAGIGIAAVVGAGITTTFYFLKKQEFDDGQFFRDPSGTLIRRDMTRSGALALEDQARTLMNTSIALYAVGGAALVTGTVLLVLDRQRTPATAGVDMPRLSVMPLPGGGLLGMETRF